VARRLALFACLLFLVACGSAFAAYPQVRGNPADRLAARPIEDFRYDHARHCVKHPSRGALALQSWLEGHVRGVSWGIMRCEKLSGHDYSLHAEGRAVDWHLDVHSPADRQAAEGLIRLLLAPDRLGNAAALARRMGIQEIIWNCHSWWSGGEGMEPYSVCYDRHGKRRKHVDETLGHRNHVHLGLNLPGARMQTSFWRR
jgi:hypothetical protein